MFKKTLAEQTVLKPNELGEVVTDPDAVRPPTPVMSVDLRRQRRAEKIARRVVGNSIPGESKMARRLRRRNGG